MLRFSDLLQTENIDRSRVRLIRHTDPGLRGKTLFDVWHSRPADFARYQSIQSPKYKLNVGNILASFIVTNQQDTLFVGCYNVGKMENVPDGTIDPIRGGLVNPDYRCYELSANNMLTAFVSRLVIQRWTDAINIIKSAAQTDPEILEIRRIAYDEPFPGHTHFSRPLADFNLYKSWHEPLRVRGVYLLTFSDGAQYVGSASGVEGFLGRWEAYVANGHGGNKKLQDRDAREARMSILEVASSRDSEEDIGKLERLWKLKLGSRAFGLNAN